MGYDLLQCGYVAVYGGITGDYFEKKRCQEPLLTD
jgi:hypothetical protein